jgi:hypothetical protein
MAQNFFYDAQLRKWILQIMRIFSEFTVQYNLDSAGNQLYTRVPVIWGDGSFQAATIQRLNSENTMPSIPMISVYINNLKYDRDRTQSPTYESSKSIRTRQYDETENAYLPTQANAYTIKRLMPAPYKLEVKVDIVTSNTQQKMQLMEQILPLFNPALEIQQTDNFLAWESLSYLELTDTVWSSRSIPVGQSNDTSYDISTLQFESPIWLTLPTNVSKMGVIFKVITDINGIGDLNDLIYGTRQVVTYNNYGLYVKNNTIRILNQGVTNTNNSNIYGQPLDWNAILSVYGNLRPGVSEIRLTYDDSANEIIGTITVDPTDSTTVLYNIDSETLPINTLSPITGIVDPLKQAPGINGLPTEAIGQSYLLIGSSNINSSNVWPLASNVANVNDIITYNSNTWITTFSAVNNIGNIQFVENNSSNAQIQWNGNAWVAGYEGPYNAASWRLII